MNPAFELLGSIRGAIVATALLLAAANAVGGLLIRPAVARPSIDAFLLRIPVGLCLIAAFGVAVGTAKCLSGSRSIWLLLGLSLLNFTALLHRPTASLQRATSRRARFSWLTLPAVVLLVVTLGPALSYPTGWDELVYHHVLPKRWLADGWPAFYSDLPYSGFPSLGEILFWLMAPIDGVIAPRLLTWVCWIIGLAIVYRLLRRRIDRTSAGGITLAFSICSAVLLVSANCYVETIQMVTFAGLLLALNAGKRRANQIGIAGWRMPAIVGALAGATAAVKLTGIAIIFVPCLWHVIRYRWRLGLRESVRTPLVYLACALAVALPFYLRPWLLTGNPFYPYFAQWFSDGPARLEMSRYHHALGAAFGVHGPAGFYAGPVLLAFDEQLYDGSFGWQLCIFLALGAVALWQARGKRARPLVLGTAGVSFLLYCFWFFTAQQARFAIPAIIALLLFAAFGLRQLRGSRRQLVLGILLAAALVSAPWRTAGHYFGSWLSVLGVISRADYVNESTDREYLPLVRVIADQTPPTARLLLLFEHRGFYLPRSYIIGTPFFQETGFTPPESFVDPDGIMDVLAREDVSHVIMTKEPTGPDRAGAWFDRLNPLLGGIAQCVERGKLRPIWETDRYVLLEVTAR
jgi:hypothetical protein